MNKDPEEGGSSGGGKRTGTGSQGRRTERMAVTSHVWRKSESVDVTGRPRAGARKSSIPPSSDTVLSVMKHQCSFVQIPPFQYFNLKWWVSGTKYLHLESRAHLKKKKLLNKTSLLIKLVPN